MASVRANSARVAAAARLLLFHLLLDTIGPRLRGSASTLPQRRSAQYIAPAQPKDGKLKAVRGSEFGVLACELRTLCDSELRTKRLPPAWFYQSPARRSRTRAGAHRSMPFLTMYEAVRVRRLDPPGWG